MLHASSSWPRVSKDNSYFPTVMTAHVMTRKISGRIGKGRQTEAKLWHGEISFKKIDPNSKDHDLCRDIKGWCHLARHTKMVTRTNNLPLKTNLRSTFFFFFFALFFLQSLSEFTIPLGEFSWRTQPAFRVPLYNLDFLFNINTQGQDYVNW